MLIETTWVRKLFYFRPVVKKKSPLVFVLFVPEKNQKLHASRVYQLTITIRAFAQLAVQRKYPFCHKPNLRKYFTGADISANCCKRAVIVGKKNCTLRLGSGILNCREAKLSAGLQKTMDEIIV